MTCLPQTQLRWQSRLLQMLLQIKSTNPSETPTRKQGRAVKLARAEKSRFELVPILHRPAESWLLPLPRRCRFLSLLVTRLNLSVMSAAPLVETVQGVVSFANSWMRERIRPPLRDSPELNLP